MRLWGYRIAIALALFLVVVSFLPLWRTDDWWVREWDYPRLQVAALLLILGVLIAWLAERRDGAFWASAAAIVAALAWQISHFVAYLPLWPKQVAEVAQCPAGRSLSLLNANVLLPNHRYAELRAMVAKADADIVVLLEPGPEWRAAMRPLYARYPYRLGEAAPNTYGMIMLSKRPLAAKLRHLLQPGVPSIVGRLTMGDGETIMLYTLHPEPPWPGDDSGERDAELITVGREVRTSGRAAIVLGDLNDVAWSDTSRLFRKIGGMGDPRVGRGLYPTFNAKYPLLRWPLDHMFVTPHWSLQKLTRLRSPGSDHFAILYRFCLTQPAGKRIVARHADAAVRHQASEQLEEGKEESVEENAGQ